MKKIFLIIFFLGICFSAVIYSWQSRMLQTAQIPDVQPDRLQQMIESGEDFYVYFYSPTCEECIKSEPKLIQAVKELKLKTIVKVDVQKYETLRQELQIPGTPTIYGYAKSKLIKGITGGFTTVEEYKKFFRGTGGMS